MTEQDKKKVNNSEETKNITATAANEEAKKKAEELNSKKKVDPKKKEPWIPPKYNTFWKTFRLINYFIMYHCYHYEVIVINVNF